LKEHVSLVRGIARHRNILRAFMVALRIEALASLLLVAGAFLALKLGTSKKGGLEDDSISDLSEFASRVTLACEDKDNNVVHCPSSALLLSRNVYPCALRTD
jgi:hypothetical protein